MEKFLNIFKKSSLQAVIVVSIIANFGIKSELCASSPKIGAGQALGRAGVLATLRTDLGNENARIQAAKTQLALLKQQTQHLESVDATQLKTQLAQLQTQYTQEQALLADLKEKNALFTQNNQTKKNELDALEHKKISLIEENRKLREQITANSIKPAQVAIQIKTGSASQKISHLIVSSGLTDLGKHNYLWVSVLDSGNTRNAKATLDGYLKKATITQEEYNCCLKAFNNFAVPKSGPMLATLKSLKTELEQLIKNEQDF